MSRVLEDNPSATYRGFRKQALYCLYRLTHSKQNEIYQPEGEEDLAIYSSDQELLEVIQVKDYSSTLSTSSFKPIFFKRILAHCTSPVTPHIKIISFGPVSEEFQKAITAKTIPKRVLTTITKAGLSSKEAKQVLQNLSIQKVDEAELTQAIFNKLKETSTSGNPLHTFQNLMWWLVTTAEDQSYLTSKELISKIALLGKFITQRNAHVEEWNTSILPIEQLTIVNDQKDQLQKEFLEGGRVQISHIQAGLDVPRHLLLEKIEASFKLSNTVVIRAASGQGKTTLALRYLIDYCPQDFRFEVLRPANIQHARKMAAAISGHLESTHVPTLLYLDVRPSDQLWVEFAREITISNKHIRLLITIREEDWFRANISYDDFHYTEVTINFNEDTAYHLYQQLQSQQPNTQYLNFDDVWKQLGEQKSLFEFIYLLTQRKSLVDKIHQQISTIEAEVSRNEASEYELLFLRLVAIASAYEARLNLKALAKFCKLKTPQRTLKRFNNEYLVRTSENGEYVEGFHAVRSKILCSRLIDSCFSDWETTACEALPFIDENDLELFLLCSFSRHKEARTAIQNEIQRLIPKSWAGVYGICSALLWLGIDEYLSENEAIIQDARKILSNHWWILWDWDLAQASSKSIDLFSPLEESHPQFKIASQASQLLSSKQTNKHQIFVNFSNWITQLNKTPPTPLLTSEFSALAKTVFWVGHLKVDTKQEWITATTLTQALENLPIDLFSELALATRKFKPHIYNNWLLTCNKKLSSKVFQETKIVAISSEHDGLVAHYIIDPHDEALMDNWDAEINDQSVKQVEIISRCFPDHSTYGASGYGHLIPFHKDLELIHDPSIKRISTDNFLDPWAPKLNAVSRNLINYKHRPSDWQTYFAQIADLRKALIKIANQLHATLKKIHTKSLYDLTVLKEHKALLSEEVLFPTSAVDEWGYLSEVSNKSTDNQTSHFAIKHLASFAKALMHYRQTFSSFIRQVEYAIVLLPYLNNASSPLEKENILTAGEENGIDRQTIHLATNNAIECCIKLEELHRQEKLLRVTIASPLLPSDELLDKEHLAIFKVAYLWSKKSYPNQFPQKLSNKYKTTNRPQIYNCLIPTINRINETCKPLRKLGIRVKVYTDQVQWLSKSALWVVIDVNHPIDMMTHHNEIWTSLSKAFIADHEKIVKRQAINLFWHNIIVVPLIQGRSVGKAALPYIKYGMLQADTQKWAEWYFQAAPIPEHTWEGLNLITWEVFPNWQAFDDLINAQSTLLQYINHLADLIRLENVEISNEGENNAQYHINQKTKLIQKHAQDMIDTVEPITALFPENLTLEFAEQRPELIECMKVFTKLDGLLLPTRNFKNTATLNLDMLLDWKKRLDEATGYIILAKSLLIADTLQHQKINLN